MVLNTDKFAHPNVNNVSTICTSLLIIITIVIIIITIVIIIIIKNK